MKRRVVFIEDDTNFAEMLIRCFKQHAPDWDVVVCGTMLEGREACAWLTHLIIFDLALPDSLREDSIRLIPMFSNVAPLEVLSGSELRDTNAFDDCFRNGAEDVWEKTSLHADGLIYFIHSCNAAIARRELRPQNEQRL